MSEIILDTQLVDFSGADITRHDVPDMELKELGVKIVEKFVSNGYCYIKNHGLDENLIEQLLETFHRFFELPEDLKCKHVLQKGHYSGWLKMGDETVHPGLPFDLKESYNYAPAYDTDIWPPVEGLESTAKSVFAQCTNLAFRPCDAISLGLDQDRNFFRNRHSIGQKTCLTSMRASFYPPIDPRHAVQPGQMRFGEHSDYGFMSFFFLNKAGGFEVKTVKNGFVAARYVPGAILLTASDLLQRWTSDRIVATLHRVVVPASEEKRRRSQSSLVFYVQPDNDCLVECLDGSNKYPPITSYDHCAKKLNVTI